MIVDRDKFLECINNAFNQLEFIKQDSKGNEGYWAFKLEAISSNNPTYNLLSDLVRDTGLDTNTSYTMVADGLTSIKEALDEWEGEAKLDTDDDRMTERFVTCSDALTPIYNTDIMEFVKNNYSAVDESIEEMGKADSLITDGRIAYCTNLERIIFDLVRQLSELVNDNERTK